MNKNKNSRCGFFICCSTPNEKHLIYKDISQELEKNNSENSIKNIKETKLRAEPSNLSNINDEKQKAIKSDGPSKENIDMSQHKSGSIINDEKSKSSMPKNLNDISSSSHQSLKLIKHKQSNETGDEKVANLQKKFSKNNEIAVGRTNSNLANYSYDGTNKNVRGLKRNSDPLVNNVSLGNSVIHCGDINLISDRENVQKKMKNSKIDNSSISNKNYLFPNSSVSEQLGLIKNLMGNNSDLAMPLLTLNKEGIIETCRFPISRTKLMSRQSSSKGLQSRERLSDSYVKNCPDIIIEDRHEQSIYNTPRNGAKNYSDGKVNLEIKSPRKGDAGNLLSNSSENKLKDNKKYQPSEHSKEIKITFSGSNFDNKLHREKLSNFKPIDQNDNPKLSKQPSLSRNNELTIKEFSQGNVDSCFSFEKFDEHRSIPEFGQYNTQTGFKRNNSAGLRFLSIKEVSISFFKFLTIEEKIFALRTFRKTLILAHGIEFFKRLCYLALQNEIWNGLNEKNKPLLYKYLSDDSTTLMTLINNSVQLSYWDLFIDFENLGEVMLEKQFDSNRARINTEIDYIDKDVDRTLSHLINSVYTQRMIKDVLVALTNAIPGGYSQGISSIAGALILKLLQMVNFGEEKDYSKIKVISYWVMKYLLVKMDLQLLYEKELDLYSLLCYQFDILIEYYLPELKQVMNSQNFDIKMMACNWFLNIYSDVLPIQLQMNIWNAFMAKGYKVLLQVGLAILSQSKDEILRRAKKSDDGIVMFFCEKSYLNHLLSKKVAEEVKKYKIPYRILTQMETFYQENKKAKELIKLSIFLDNEDTLKIKTVPKLDKNKLSMSLNESNYHTAPNVMTSEKDNNKKYLITSPGNNKDREKYNFFDSTIQRSQYHHPKGLKDDSKADENVGFFNTIKNWFTGTTTEEENKENKNVNNQKADDKNPRKISGDVSVVNNPKYNYDAKKHMKREDDDVDYLPMEIEEIKDNDPILDNAAQKFRDDTLGTRGNNLKTTLM